ncbi:MULTISPECIES: peptide deformylase [Peptoniphilus]|uniref:peptide deformylase n=1 Tax=Peptoniphilus TaxID=162289 RepID=UPI0001DA9C06|nr:MULTISPECIES: peptide deformylase [Peptoniphilus]EFI42195.1 peptide deformylase [Peptoniphilus sp. oral taxon 386 str. F0131]
MAYRVIRTDDDPVLRKISREVVKFDDRLKTLIEDMYETMDKAEGVGLAAPQVGVLRRVITVDDRTEHRFALINPEIIFESGTQLGYEGCLSLPNKQGKVKRFNEIKVKYLDENGEKKEIEAKEYLARILQHEIDHLNGILYSDIAEEMYVINSEDEEI